MCLWEALRTSLPSGEAVCLGGCYLSPTHVEFLAQFWAPCFLTNMFKNPLLDWEEAHQPCVGAIALVSGWEEFCPGGDRYRAVSVVVGCYKLRRMLTAFWGGG